MRIMEEESLVKGKEWLVIQSAMSCVKQGVMWDDDCR